MIGLALLAFLAYRNSIRAKQKDQNVFAWALYTVIAFISTMLIGTFVVIFGFLKDAVNINLFSSTDPKVREAAQQQLEKLLTDNPLHSITIMFFGIGGYLLVRYLLERKPGKKKPEVHWMDKMNEQQ